MRYLKTFESHSSKGILIIVDVQKSFSEFFTDEYVAALKKYCKGFDEVYQIWDNHHLGKNVDKDYLYDDNHETSANKDLYHFPNQVDLIEKRYNYDVDADFYRPVLDENIFEEIKRKEENGELVRGDFFHTSEGTIIVYIGNNHKWFHVPKKLYDLFSELAGAQAEGVKHVVIVGGAQNECILDVEVAARSMGLKVRQEAGYVYSATNCPIK